MATPDNFKDIIPLVIEHEGGSRFTADPVDPGGDTKYGISQRAYPDLDIKGLNKRKAVSIYLNDYWKPSKAEELPDHLRYIYFDMCVNMGKKRAVMILQRALNRHGADLTIDGGIGPKTIAAANQKYKGKYLETERVRAYRVMFYARLVNTKESMEKYWYGWYKRSIRV